MLPGGADHHDLSHGIKCMGLGYAHLSRRPRLGSALFSGSVAPPAALRAHAVVLTALDRRSRASAAAAAARASARR